MSKIPMSITGYSCPMCGAAHDAQHSMISMTTPQFKTQPDPHYSWTEIHKCVKCESKYKLKNAT